MHLFTLPLLLLGLAGVQDETSGYRIQGTEFEGCACDVYCPCVWEQDATAEQCQAVTVWSIDRGHFERTRLDGLAFVLVVTKTGRNLSEAAGTWEGILYVPERGTEDQNRAITAIVRDKFGPVFAKLDVIPAPIEVRLGTDRHELRMGKISRLEIVALRGANGKPIVLHNPPSPYMIAEVHYGRADVHRYDDGKTSWDFSGRNAFFGPFEFSSD